MLGPSSRSSSVLSPAAISALSSESCRESLSDTRLGLEQLTNPELLTLDCRTAGVKEGFPPSSARAAARPPPNPIADGSVNAVETALVEGVAVRGRSVILELYVP